MVATGLGESEGMKAPFKNLALGCVLKDCMKEIGQTRMEGEQKETQFLKLAKKKKEKKESLSIRILMYVEQDYTIKNMTNRTLYYKILSL